MPAKVGSRIKLVAEDDFNEALADLAAVERIQHAVRHRLALLIQRAMTQREISPYDLKKIGAESNISAVLRGKK